MTPQEADEIIAESMGTLVMGGHISQFIHGKPIGVGETYSRSFHAMVPVWRHWKENLGITVDMLEIIELLGQRPELNIFEAAAIATARKKLDIQITVTGPKVMV